jgi:hypothetical protein
MVSKERRNRKQTREKQYNACDVGTYREEAKKNEKTRTKEIQRAAFKKKKKKKYKGLRLNQKERGKKKRNSKNTLSAVYRER